MLHTKHKAFTLVELIVVVTILAILGTIAFISLQGYSLDARDSQRINDIKVIEKGFSIHNTRGKELPVPDEHINITASGTLLGYQGTVGSGVLTQIGQAGKIADPLDGSRYSYLKNVKGKSFQLLAHMEKIDSVIDGGDNAEGRFPKIQGSGLGILRNVTLNQPLEKAHVGTDFDIFQNNEEYKSYLNDTSFYYSSGSLLGSFLALDSRIEDVYKSDPNLVGILDYNITDEFISPGGLGTDLLGTPELKDGYIQCDGSSTILFGSGSDVLGGSDEITIYASYLAEELGHSTAYPMVISSWGTTSGYNIACQHNLADVSSPLLSCYFDMNDGAGNITQISGQSTIQYGVKQDILMTGKDGVGKIYINGKKVTEESYIGTVNESRGEGFGLCSRPTTGHSLNGKIYKIYISDVGLESDSNIDAFYQKIKQ